MFSLMCRPYSTGLCVSVSTDNKTRKRHGRECCVSTEENNCRIYVTGKQEVGVLERVKETSKWQTWGQGKGPGGQGKGPGGKTSTTKSIYRNAIINRVSLHAN